MIEINLIPPAARKKSVSGMLSAAHLGLPWEMVVGISGAVIVVLLGLHLAFFTALAVQSTQLALAKAEWQGVLPQRNTIDALGSELKALKKKMTTLEGISISKNMGWSHRLNAVSDAMVKGMWLKRISYDTRALTMEGLSSVKDGANEMVTVGNFASNLKKDVFFMKDIASVDLGAFTRSKINGVEVASFTVTAKLK